MRKTNGKRILIDINAFVVLKIYNKSSMWSYPIIVKSDLELVVIYFDVFSAQEILKNYLDKDANMDFLLLKNNHL